MRDTLNRFLKWNHTASLKNRLYSEQMRLAMAQDRGHSLSAYVHECNVEWLSSQLAKG